MARSKRTALCLAVIGALMAQIAMAIYVSTRGLPPHRSTGADNPGNGDNSPIKFGYILE
jgi:hypothetical protein